MVIHPGFNYYNLSNILMIITSYPGDPSIIRNTFYVKDTEAYNSILPLDTFLDVVRFVLVLIRLK